MRAQELAEVWRLADVDKDAKLNFAEFACAMTLIARRRQALACRATLARSSDVFRTPSRRLTQSYTLNYA